MAPKTNTPERKAPRIGQNKLNTGNLTWIALMTAVLCVLGPWALVLPFSPIPFSLCTLGVYFAGILLGWKAGTLSVLLYLLLGFVGLPVFTGFMGGPAKFFGPTGGYLMGYLFMALICGLFAEKFAKNHWLRILGMCLGTAGCYLFGSMWLAYQLEISYSKALVIGVLPYLVGDLVKILIATTVGSKLRTVLLRTALIQ